MKHLSWSGGLVWLFIGCGSDHGPSDGEGGEGAADEVPVVADDGMTEWERPDGPCSDESECAWWTGRLLVKGESLSLEQVAPTVKVAHCEEAQLDQVFIELVIAAEPPESDREQHVLRFVTWPKKVTLGQEIPLRKEQPKAETPARVLAQVSTEGKPPSFQMPNQGTLQFFAIEEGGPVDLVFDLDFGEFGQPIQGRIRSEQSRAKTCQKQPRPTRVGPPREMKSVQIPNLPN